MKKAIIKLLERIGVIPPKVSNVNQPCYDKYGRFIGWYSRSVAVAVFVFCMDKNGVWYVLGSERGPEAADYQGWWNCSCGYLDHSETITQAGARELFEETGVEIDHKSLKFVGYEDSPNANRQNVTFRFSAFITDKEPGDFKFSHKMNEGREVGDIRWIRIDEIDHYRWAFKHDKRIKEIFEAEMGQKCV